ncbi:GlsB/YeaQ/YmgE family stress response membrane protein [Clostridium algidicarnis]|uniref:GlsB/YeaQ/YmgE family stress response membrane protein n=1 Tax=Clostridium algidicarnis TaxID=37659 RepID=UPI001C0D0CDF|nr:GlsB/YeaQ/YmgE family stress response membrane protein [Clostridium algidicarnis]MBU3205788.1 GlsB/YeaQ/YmgE family stress response membrane protein [Clostridium algidicarnis]
MGILAWIILGALSGWITSMITGKDSEMGAMANIIVGIIGAFLGGFLFGLIGGKGITGFNIWSLLVSVIGAVILLAIINAIKKK